MKLGGPLQIYEWLPSIPEMFTLSLIRIQSCPEVAHDLRVLATYIKLLEA